MLKTVILSSVMCLGISSAAAANCNCHSSGSYDMGAQNGVTVLRGNIPSNLNPQRAVIAAGQTAEARAQSAERRARRAERELTKSRADITPRGSSHSHSHSSYGYSRGYTPRYNSGSYGFGASLAAPRFARGSRRGGFKGRGFNGHSGRGISRPVFSTRIRG